MVWPVEEEAKDEGLGATATAAAAAEKRETPLSPEVKRSRPLVVLPCSGLRLP
jgi:hypothetical protein